MCKYTNILAVMYWLCQTGLRLLEIRGERINARPTLSHKWHLRSGLDLAENRQNFNILDVPVRS